MRRDKIVAVYACVLITVLVAPDTAALRISPQIIEVAVAIVHAVLVVQRQVECVVGTGCVVLGDLDPHQLPDEALLAGDSPLQGFGHGQPHLVA